MHVSTMRLKGGRCVGQLILAECSPRKSPNEIALTKLTNIARSVAYEMRGVRDQARSTERRAIPVLFPCSKTHHYADHCSFKRCARSRTLWFVKDTVCSSASVTSPSLKQVSAVSGRPLPLRSAGVNAQLPLSVLFLVCRSDGRPR